MGYLDTGRQIDRLQDAGLTVRNCGNGHFQISGGLKPLNWYPFSKKRSVYINGAKQAIHLFSRDPVPLILNFVIHGELPSQKGSPRKVLTNVRRRLHQKNPRCDWCKKELEFEASTLDHIIPLSKGGSNRADNLCLSCVACNRARGNSTKAPRETLSTYYGTGLMNQIDEHYRNHHGMDF